MSQATKYRLLDLLFHGFWLAISCAFIGAGHYRMSQGLHLIGALELVCGAAIGSYVLCDLVARNKQPTA